MSARKMTARRFFSGAGVAAVATVAGMISYSHQRHLAASHGQPELLAAAWPLAVDGLVLACGVLVTTDRAGGFRPRVWAVVGFWLGVVVSVATNALATEGGLIARAVSAFPAVALLIAVESLSTRPRQRKLVAEVTQGEWKSEPAQAEVTAEISATSVRKSEAEAPQVSAQFPHLVHAAIERKPRAEIVVPIEGKSQRKPETIQPVERTPETTWAAAEALKLEDPSLSWKAVAERVGVTDRRLRQIRNEVAQTVSA